MPGCIFFIETITQFTVQIASAKRGLGSQPCIPKGQAQQPSLWLSRAGRRPWQSTHRTWASLRASLRPTGATASLLRFPCRWRRNVRVGSQVTISAALQASAESRGGQIHSPHFEPEERKNQIQFGFSAL